MGIGLSLYTVYALARVTVPTFVEGLRGPVQRGRIDDRARALGAQVVRKARMQLTVAGTELVPGGRAYVYMSNHQSHIDIPVIFHTIPSPTVRMVGKRELFRIPVWGQALRAAGFICVDRTDRRAAIASLDEARRQVEDGVSIWIAPEGTRSRTGAIGPLKKGGFHLALATAAPIVPIAIDGTRQVLPSQGKRMRYDVPVRVTYGAPIPVEGASVPALMERVAAFFREHVGPGA